MKKKNIYDFTYNKWISWFMKRGYTEYRAGQVWDYLYRKRVKNFAGMTNVKEEPLVLIKEFFSFDNLTLAEKQESRDGTIKFLFQLWDGHHIETVMMKFEYGISICVTTQIGCNMGCGFCASGLLKKTRNLSPGEIIGQIISVQHYLDKLGTGKSISNVVLMGTGEPFDNFTNVVDALDILLNHKGLAIPGRSVTVSTSGLSDKIREFADINLPVNLAVSLHGTNNQLRSQIMKVNRVHPLEELMEAVNYYIQVTNRRLTIEYILLKGINDLGENAIELSDLLKPFKKKVYVNLIPYNPVDEYSQYKRSDEATVLAFYDALKKQGIQCKTRQEQGTDIDAACGQLRVKRISEDKEKEVVE